MFSVNLTFDKTLMTQFCCFFSAKIATFWGYKCVSIQIKLNLNIFRSATAVLHSSTLVDRPACMLTIWLEYSFRDLNIYYVIG